MSRVTRIARAAREKGWRGWSRWPPAPLRGAWRSWRERVPTSLSAALAALLIVFVLAGVAGYAQRVRRTAEAQVEIVRIDTHHSPGLGATGSSDVQYRFEVDGAVLEFLAVRDWGIATIREAKVCYEPADPRNQALVRAGDTCG